MDFPEDSEDPATRIRHDLRNRLAAIRNAALYVQRSLERRGVQIEDARVPKFLELIAEQVRAADALLDQQREAAHAAGVPTRRA